MIEPLYVLRFHNGRRTRPEEETKVKKGVLEIKKKKQLLLGGSSSTGSCHQNCWLVWLSQKASKREKRWRWRQFCLYEGPLDLPASSAFTPRRVRCCAWGGPRGAAVGGQTLMSWDSTILARVFFTRRMVRREAGLRAQHSDISFSMARRHWARAHRWKKYI